MNIHIIPVGDLELHRGQETCWCHPLKTYDNEKGNVIVHNAKDCREAKERRFKIGVSEGWILIGELQQPRDCGEDTKS